MSMKPGATTRPVASISRLALPGRHAADGDDPVAADGDVAVEPRVAGAVDDPAVADEQVVGRLGRRGRDRHGKRQDWGEVFAVHRMLLPTEHPLSHLAIPASNLPSRADGVEQRVQQVGLAHGAGRARRRTAR